MPGHPHQPARGSSGFSVRGNFPRALQSGCVTLRAMLDIRLIRENPDLVKERLATRGGDAQARIDEILACDKERRSFETRLASSRRPQAHQQGDRRAQRTRRRHGRIGGAGARDRRRDRAPQRADGRGRHEAARSAFAVAEPAARQARRSAAIAGGQSGGAHRGARSRTFDFQPKSHIELGEKLGLFDFERAVEDHRQRLRPFTPAPARGWSGR